MFDFYFLDVLESPTFRKFGDLLENLFEFDDECDAPSFGNDVGKLLTPVGQCGYSQRFSYFPHTIFTDVPVSNY